MPVEELFFAISDADADVDDVACILRRFILPEGYSSEWRDFSTHTTSDRSPLITEDQDDLVQLRLAIETSDDTTDYDDFRQELGLD